MEKNALFINVGYLNLINVILLHVHTCIITQNQFLKVEHSNIFCYWLFRLLKTRIIIKNFKIKTSRGFVFFTQKELFGFVVISCHKMNIFVCGITFISLDFSPVDSGINKNGQTCLYLCQGDFNKTKRHFLLFRKRPKSLCQYYLIVLNLNNICERIRKKPY